MRVHRRLRCINRDNELQIFHCICPSDMVLKIESACPREAASTAGAALTAWDPHSHSIHATHDSIGFSDSPLPLCLVIRPTTGRQALALVDWKLRNTQRSLASLFTLPVPVTDSTSSEYDAMNDLSEDSWIYGPNSLIYFFPVSLSPPASHCACHSDALKLGRKRHGIKYPGNWLELMHWKGAPNPVPFFRRHFLLLLF